MNCTPIVGQYDILKTIGVILCQKENQAKNTQGNSSKR